MEACYDTLKAAYTRAVIIAISMIGSVLVYVVVAEMLHNSEPPWRGIALNSTHRYYYFIRYGLMALGLIGVLLAAKISTAVNLSPKKLENPVPALLTHAVILSGASDMVGMLGLVLFLMAGNIADMYMFGGISLGLSVVFFPRMGRWKELAEPWLTAPAAQPADEKLRVKPAYWKLTIIILAMSLLMLMGIVFGRESAFEEEYSFLLWPIFFPLTVIALLYFFSFVAPRMARESGRKVDCRPVFWHAYSILGSLMFGAILIFSVRQTLVASMDWLNSTPVQVESVISGASRSTHSRVRLDIADKCWIYVHYSGRHPVRTPWPLEKMSSGELHKLAGKKVILVGRKSFAGTVIDEIRLPSDKAIGATSSSSAIK